MLLSEYGRGEGTDKDNSTLQEAKSNVDKFLQELAQRPIMLDKINKNSQEITGIKKIVDSPALQGILKTALIKASRTDSQELHESLARLIIERVHQNDNDSIKIWYNKSIEIIDQLNEHQIKYLTFLSISSYWNSKVSSNNFRKYYEKLVDFDITMADILDLDSMGCVSCDGLQYNYHHDNWVKKHNALASSSDRLVTQVTEILKKPIVKHVQAVTPLGLIIAYTNYVVLFNEPINNFHEQLRKMYG